MNCQKRRFGNKAVALLDLERINLKYGHKRHKTPSKVYRCGQCGGLYLTSRERAA